MMVLESKTYIASPPGETISEMMEDQRITQMDLAARMGVSEMLIHDLISGEGQLTEQTAGQLSKALGMDAQFWLNLERYYREDLAKVTQENAQEVYECQIDTPQAVFAL